MKTFKYVLLHFLLAVLFACGPQERNQNETHNQMNLRFLALGDSYTIGEGVAENERWPNQLQDSLSQRGFQMESPLIIARTGWTTGELKAGIEAAALNSPDGQIAPNSKSGTDGGPDAPPSPRGQEGQIDPNATYSANDSTDPASPEGPFDLVSLLIGVNNQYRGPARGFTLDGYRAEFAELLQMAIAFAGGEPGRVLVVSIPDYGVTPFVAPENKDRVGMEIDQYNAVNLEESQKAGVRYADITPISRMAAGRPELIASDQLHPSGVMYSLWVEQIIPDLLPLLQAKR
jgi:acyl-CoA thioesterase I